MLLIPALVAALLQSPTQQPLALTAGTRFDTTIGPGVAHAYTVRLDANESAALVFRQMGVDLVVEVYDPAGSLLATVDSPNGRTGDEPVEIIARIQGAFLLRVRPYGPQEPAGRYSVSVQAVRSASATALMVQARTQARDSASAWLRRRTALATRTTESALDAKFDSIARRARVVGLGEATHGSREFGDARLRFTKRAIERGGYRIVALEGSATDLARLNRYISSRDPRTPAPILVGGLGWIGRRTERELIPWLRDWNARHPNDLVSLVGVDPQQFLPALAEVRGFLRQAYGERVATQWTAIEREVAAADSQTYVFGNSRVDSIVRRQLFDLVATLQADAPILRRLHGDSAYQSAATTLSQIAQFADFNAGRVGVVGHNRDWYMAANLLRVLEQRRDAKAVFWAHNAHIAHPAGRTALNGTAGTVLRATLGCSYQAIAMTFGEGSFVAQRPDDPDNRLAIDSLPPNVDESVERVIGRFATSTALSAWGCIDGAAAMPSWLSRPQQMRWVGGIWAPGSNAAEANRPTELLRDYDALLYFTRVRADEAPADRPVIRPRPR